MTRAHIGNADTVENLSLQLHSEYTEAYSLGWVLMVLHFGCKPWVL